MKTKITDHFIYIYMEIRNVTKLVREINLKRVRVFFPINSQLVNFFSHWLNWPLTNNSDFKIIIKNKQTKTR